MSDTSSRNIYFAVQPGVISAFFFVLFDLVLLAVLDIVLARVVCYLYYRRIQVGIPIDVRSTDIPGVTTFLVGKLWALPNLIALSVKFGFLACILLIDVKIDSEAIHPKGRMSTKAMYDFSPSDLEWAPDRIYRIVSRRWETVRNCRLIHPQSEKITYYALVFNLTDELDLETELSTIKHDTSLIDLDDKSMQCMRKGDVEEDDVVSLVEVVGCSKEIDDFPCTKNRRIDRNSTWSPPLIFNYSSILEGSGTITFAIHTLQDSEAANIFPEYEAPAVRCISTEYGVDKGARVRKYACALVSKRSDDTTVVERWQYNQTSKGFWREFAGPVFKTHIDFEQYQQVNLLRNLIRLPDWIGLSSIIVADGAVYKREHRNFTAVGAMEVQTKVPVFAIVLAGCMVVIAIASRVIVAFTIGRDVRPQLNSIDGLSSIAREECEPTGRSYFGGRGMMIGLSHRDGRQLHFGPLRSRDVSALRNGDENSLASTEHFVD